MTVAPGTRFGPYEVLSALGAGGMGEVYRARDTRLDRDVAVKVLPRHLSDDPDALARFEREARAVAATSHPNILAIFDLGSADGVAYAVTELLEGETLRARIAEGPLPVRKAVDYAAQIAEGLSAAHDRGIVHRDLKPENLFVTREGRVKVLDFGLARQITPPNSDDTHSPTLSPGTEPGTVMGTVGYMSPEQVRGLPADARSDIFSFGAVLYEMVSGRRAFQGESAAETMHAIVKEEPPDLAEAGRALPPALQRILSHCLEKRPEERFHSAHDLAFDLKALTTATGSSSAVPALAGATPRRRRIALVAAVLAAGVAVGVLGDRALGPRAVEPPTYRRLTFDRGTIGQARFAPDGNTIVYDASWRGQPTELFTARTDSRESRSLGVRGSVYAVSSASEVAVGLDARVSEEATLSRVPLAGGAPREVLDHVRWADWSPDGAELAVVRTVDGADRLEFPPGKVLYQTQGSLSHPRVSPRGDLVAFIDHGDPTSPFGAGSVVTVERAGGKRTLSGDWADLFGLAWRPDGREVWFTAARRGESKALRAVTLAGKERLLTRVMGQVDLQDISRDGRVLVNHPSFRMDMVARGPGDSIERELTWLGQSAVADLSRDGSRILFTEFPEGGGEGGAAYLRGIDGSPAVRLGDGVAQALSPDGKWALVILPSPSRLVLLPTGVGQMKDLTRPGLTYRSGSWFPDGRRLLLMAESKGTQRLYVQAVDGGEPQAVGPENVVAFAAAPDGRSLVTVLRGGKALIQPLDAGVSRPIAGFAEGDQPIGWSGDGRWLFVSRLHDQGARVDRLDPVTGRRELVAELSPADPAGVEFPGPMAAVSADGKSYAYSFLRNLSELYLIDGLR